MLRDQLNGILEDLALVGTETSLMLGAVLLLIVGLFTQRVAWIKSLYLATLCIAFYLNWQIEQSDLFLSDSLFGSAEIKGFTALFLLTGSLVLLFPRKKHLPEFYFLLLSLIVGSVFMMKSNSLLLVLLAIELVSFVSYILTGFSFLKKGFEASIKYLLFGALSSSMMLLGVGFIYGATGEISVSSWSIELFAALMPQVGLLLLLFGLFFKISIVPFHIWTPATYQEAPTDAVALFSVTPKLAGLLLLKRVVDSSGLDHESWLISVVLLLGIFSILIGTLGALRQSNARRMISFGSIAHAGFLLGFVVTPVQNYNANGFWVYSVLYAVMSVAVFYLLDRYEERSIVVIRDYATSKSETWMGGVFTLVLISLVGLPPLAGFTAKLFLFSGLWDIYQSTNATMSIAYLLVAVFASVASLFFYLQIPRHIFLQGERSPRRQSVASFSIGSKIIATIFAVTLLLLFFVPKLVVSLRFLLYNAHE